MIHISKIRESVIKQGFFPVTGRQNNNADGEKPFCSDLYLDEHGIVRLRSERVHTGCDAEGSGFVDEATRA